MNPTTKRDEIVAAAFEMWGDTHFTNTSLNLVAQRLGVTKQAIYRHFRNKEDLVNELTERFLAAYGEVRDEVLAVPPDADLEKVVSAYALGLHRMFTNLPHYYIFFVLRLLPGPRAGHERFTTLAKQISSRIRPFLDSGGEPSGAFPAMLFLHVHVLVWTAFGFWTPFGRRRDGSDSISRRTRDERVLHTVSLGLRGHFPEATHEIDFAAIEQTAVVAKQDLLEPNRIFSAVESVVTEVGFEAASMDRIARALGMTKSSLYFYFENKDTMFLEALNRERRHFRTLFLERAAQQPGFSELLYCYIVAMLTYFMNNRSLMVFSDWVAAQRVPVPDSIHDEQELLATVDFLRQQLKLSDKPRRRKEVLEILALLNILMIRGVADLSLTLDRTDELFGYTRDLYRIFTHGIETKKEGNP